MKKTLNLILALASVACLASCGHEHTIKEGYAHDDTNHWQLCEGCDELIDVAAHTYGTPVVEKEATFHEEGSQKSTCTVCGYEKTEAIPAKTVKAKLEGKSSPYGAGVIDVSTYLIIGEGTDAEYGITIGGAFAGDMAGEFAIPTTITTAEDGSISFTGYQTVDETQVAVSVPVYVSDDTYYTVMPAALCGFEVAMSNKTILKASSGTAAPYGAGIVDLGVSVEIMEGGKAFYTLSIGGMMAGENAGSYTVPTTWTAAEGGGYTVTAYDTTGTAVTFTVAEDGTGTVPSAVMFNLGDVAIA